jgi:predicted aminopeptidase
MLRISRCLVAFIPCLALAGCALPYYSQAARGQISLLRQRVPIAEVIADPATGTDTRDRLELVLELREFAVTRLGLPDNDSYTSFVELDRPYVVWNVVAAAEFSTDPLTWCFPVAGCVAYRGYFEQSRAETYAARLDARGYDIFVGGATAYSTLGHFDDPVLSSMLARGETEIAATLFHELAHQRAYFKGDTELSESFATAVEQYAVELWLASRDDNDELERYRARLDRQRGFASLVAAQRNRLAAVYGSGQDPAAMAAAKQDAYAEMQRDYAGLRASWGGSSEYDGWFERDFNNAVLVALTSYQRWVPGLRAQLEALGPEQFYVVMEELAAGDADARAARLESWNAGSAPAAVAYR